MNSSPTWKSYQPKQTGDGVDAALRNRSSREASQLTAGYIPHERDDAVCHETLGACPHVRLWITAVDRRGMRSIPHETLVQEAGVGAIGEVGNYPKDSYMAQWVPFA